MINHLEERAARTGLGGIPTLVQEGQRLSEAHCLALLKSDDLALMGLLANQVREKRHGDVAYYNVNIHVNYTNYCNQYCDFCAFQRRPKTMAPIA